MDVHINTISIDFLNNLGCFFVKCLLRLPLGLLSGLHSQDMKIRNDSYLQCLDYTDISQKGYQRNYDEICDFLKDTKDIIVLRSRKSINMFFKDIKRWNIVKMFNKNIP